MVILTLSRLLSSIRAAVLVLERARSLNLLVTFTRRLFGPLAQWVEQKTMRSFGRRFEPYTAHLLLPHPGSLRHRRRRGWRRPAARRRARPG